MSDEATLVRQAEKLINALQHPDAAFKAVVNTVRQSSADIVADLATTIRATAHKLIRAEARIAELEAEVNHLQGENDRLRDVRESRIAELEDEAASHREIEEMVLRAKAARIAELEAERDRLKAALELVRRTTQMHIEVVDAVDAALSDPSGEKA